MTSQIGNHSTTNGVSVIQGTAGTRILCVADVRGKLSQINAMAQRLNAQYVIHTGDFGFYDNESLERMNEKTLKHVIQYSPLIPRHMSSQFAGSTPHDVLKNTIRKHAEPILSELPLFLNKNARFDVPVYTTWGACEDVRVLEKFRSAEYQVENLFLVDEHDSRLLEVGGIKLRLLGLGGAVVMHKLFDNGEGRTTIAGGQGTMWTTVLQMGELIETALATFDRSETRVFVSHMSPGREGLLAQLALALRADFTISAGLHFRYGTSYNEFSVNPNLDHFRNRLAASRSSFADVWDTVKPEVVPIVQPPQKKLIDNVLQIIEMAAQGERGSTEEVGFKNLWNFNLPDANYGSLILEIKEGQIASEQRSEGFNFDYRRSERRVKTTSSQPVEQTVSAPSPAPPTKHDMARLHPKFDAAMSGNAMQTPAPSAATAPSTTEDESALVIATTAAEPSQSEQQPEARPPPTASPSTSGRQQGPGRPTPQLWIGDPPSDPRELFSPEHRDKIQRHHSQTSKFGQHYAVVYFNSVEDATAALESLDLTSGTLKVRYGNDRYGTDYHDRAPYSRSGDSFGRLSYDARKSSDDNRGGFGRGGRGGRGGSISSRGSGPSSFGGRGSPAPRGRGGSRGPPSKDSAEQPADSMAWTSGDDVKPVDENKGSATSPAPAVAATSSAGAAGQPTTATGASSSTGGSTAAVTPGGHSSTAAGESNSQST